MRIIIDSYIRDRAGAADRAGARFLLKRGES